MTLRPMTETERMYSYTQSQQLIMQSGCIGHLSANFGSDNKHFNTSWDDHRADLKSPDFEHEFEEVIQALREDQLPKWAALGLDQYRNEQRQKSHKTKEGR